MMKNAVKNPINAVKRALTILMCALLAVCFAACGGDNVPDVSSAASAESAAIISEPASESVSEAEAASAAQSEEISAPEEISEAISEPVSEPAPEESAAGEKKTLEKPAVFGCTMLYDGAYVLLGHCPEGAVIYCSASGTEYVTGSDHGWFSLRVKYTRASEKVVLHAETEDGVSPELEYTSRPKRVDSDKWAIIAGKDYQFHLDYTLQDFLHTNLYSNSQIKSVTSSLKSRKTKTQAEVIYVVVPSPASVYPETMPEEYIASQKGDTSKYDQLMQIFENAGVTYINVKELFTEHKNDDYKLYWKTDSHWSEYGAYLVYKELFDIISQKFPAASPRAFDEFEWKEGTFRGGDMAYYLEYADNVMQEYNVARIPKFEMPDAIKSVSRYVSADKLTYDQDSMPAARTIETGRSELPSALILRDSYSTQLYDILAERFNKTIFKGMWSFSFNAQEVKDSGVDYVIYILTERNIGSAFH